MRCDASSDDRATALPVIYLIVLISTYQVSSAWLECRALQRKKVKVWCADRGLNPGPFTCRANALTTELPTPLYFLCNPERMLLNYRHPCMRCDASSDDRATALPVIYLVLISTYQVSSAWLECRALQRKIVKVLMRRPGIEPGTPRLPGECSDHWATDTFVLSVQSWAYITELQTSMYEMWCIYWYQGNHITGHMYVMKTF